MVIKLRSLFITLLYAMLFVTGCGKKALPPREYVEWIKSPENGLKKNIQIGELLFEIQYKPSEFIVVNEFKGNVSDKVKFNNRIQEIDDLIYFDLKISMKGKQDFLEISSDNKQEYYQKMYFLSFDFQKEIKLQDGDEIKDCILYHFEKSYDLEGVRTFVLGFKKTKNETDKTISIDTKFLEAGIVKIKFDNKLMQGLPQLEI